MAFQARVEHARVVIEGTPGDRELATVRDATRLLEACLSHAADSALLYAENLPSGFFDLSSGIAGEILQKCRNYNIQLAVVQHSIDGAMSSRFPELLEEERRGRNFGVFETRAAALAWIQQTNAAPAVAEAHIEPLSDGTFDAAGADLIALLRACVHGGASIGFLAPLDETAAAAYWASLTAQVQAGTRAVVVAREGSDGPIVGSGQLAFETKPNGRHRAEVNKVMVLPSHRRRGIAAQIMTELERLARDRGLRLLFLDTSEGAGGAQAFYDTRGYTYAGGIPEYALDPDGRPAKNAIYYKLL